MAQIVKLRRSSVPGQKPTNSNLQLGELALNTTDGKVYMAKSGSLGPSVEELILTNTVNTGSLHLVGSITASAFSGSASGLTNVPFHITGSDVEGNTYNKQFTKLQFDDSTGLNVSESVPGTAFISIGSHFKDIFVSGSPILSATGSDAFEVIGAGGLGISTSITDTNGNGYIKELTISAVSLSSSLNNRMDTITGSITTLSSSLDSRINTLNTFTSSVVLTSQTSSMNVLSASYALTAAFALNASAGNNSVTDGAYAVLNQTTPATTWTFKHSLGQRYPIFQVFDSNGVVIIPSQITTIDVDNATITFPSNQTGKVIASLGTGPGGLSQYFSSNATWSLAHNLGSDYPIVTIWDSNRNIIFPQRIESVDTNNIKVYFSTPVAGYVNVAKGGHIISGSVGAGSIDFIGTNIVSGSAQILITGTTGYSTFSGSISSSIGSLSSSVATTTLGLSSSILSLSSSVATTTSGLSSSIGSLSSSVATTTLELSSSILSLSSSVATTTSGLTSTITTLSSSLSGSIDSLSSSVASINNTQNGRLDSLETASGSIRTNFNTFTSSYNTGSFTGSFKGDGTNLYNIPASGVTGLELYKIVSGSVSASISPNNGFRVNTDVYIDGTLTAKEIHTDYVTSSVLYQSGSTKFGDTSDDNHLFTGSVLVNGNVSATSITGSINFNNLTNVPTLVSGSSQINITGTTDYSTFSSSVSTSIGSLSSSVATTTSGLSSSIGNLSSSLSSSIGSLSSSVATTTLNLKNRIDSIEGVTGSISSLNSFTSSINTTIKSKLNADGVISGSSQIIYSGLTGIPSGIVSGSSQISYTGITNIPSGIVSGSEQLTGSYDTRYVLSGSITQTTWNNIANKPNDIVSSSNQISAFGFLETGSFNTFTSSNNGRVSSLESFTASLNTNYVSETEFGTYTGSINTFTSSVNSYTSSNDGRVSSLESKTGSYATTGSNLFKGNQTISGSIIPAVDNTYDLGSLTNQFRDLYLSSASLYIDGTKVLGSTAQELQITTDTGQSFKILEASSDTITLQSADGNITLTTSGGGDVIMDPTTGVIALKGTTTLYAGNKIVSSDGNSVQFGNGIAITGSVVSTVTPLVSGSLQIIYSGLTGIPSGIISGSSQIDITGTTGYSTFSSSISTSIGSLSSSVVTTNSGLSSSIGSLSSSVATTTSGLSSSIGSLSSSIATTTVNTKNRVDSIETTTGSLNTFSSSINTTIKSKLDSESVISGSVQVVITGTTGYSTFSSSVSTSIGALSSSVATTTSDLSSSIGSLSSSVATTTSGLSSSVATTTSGLSSSIGSLSSSVVTTTSGLSSSIGSLSSSIATTTLGTKNRVDSIEAKTGSYATTGSNIFIGSQTITGSLYISQDLIVAGSSSIQHISSSIVNIGDNIITVNAQNPSIRFGGLAVIDSGSSPSVSGSMLFDSVNDQWIFIHQNQSTITSSVLLMGPQTFNSLGSESYPTTNRILKSLNAEHIGDSNISDNGTTVTILSNTIINGTISSTGTTIVSGSSQISHDSTTGYVANRHIDHTSVSISAGNGLSGGGDISATRTLTLDTGSVHFLDGVKKELNTEGVVSGSSQIIYSGLTGIPSGIVSGSSQITFSGISGLPTLVSGSSQINHNTTTNYVANQHIDHTTVSISAGNGLSGGGDISSTRTLTLDTASATFTSGVKSKMNSDGVVSGSSQVSFNGITDKPTLVSGSSQITFSGISGLPTLVSGSSQISYTGLSNIPSGIVSGSSQIDLTATTNYASGILTRLNAVGVFSGSAQVSLASTTGFGTYLNQAVLTTSTPTFSTVTATTFTGALSGNASTATTAGALTSMNISQFTNNSGYITSSGNTTGYAMSLNGYANQTVYTILDGPANGPVIKVRYDSATANRYIDIGSKDGNGVYSEGLKLYNGSTITWLGYTVYHSGNIPTWNQNTTGTASNITAYTINQSVGSSNAPTFAGGTINGSLYVNANNDITTLAGSLTLYSTGNATTSMMMFKNTTGLGYGNHGAITGTYNTYFVMDTTDRGWVWRNATTSTNIASISNTGTFTVNGNVMPTANGTQNLGGSSNRWNTLFTSDLSLSNGIGDYTIVEGENDLFLYNNKQNKVYKFMLQEVKPEDATPKRPE